MFSAKKRLAALSKFERPGAKEIPFTAQIDSFTLKTKNGDYVRTWCLQGFAHEGATDEDVNVRHEQLHLLLRNVASENVAFYSHVVRRESGEYPEGEYRPGFAHSLNEHYRRTLAQKKLFVNYLYLSVVYRPETERAQRLIGNLQRINPDEREYKQRIALRKLDDIAGSLAAGLAVYEPRALGTYEYNEESFSEMLEFQQFLVNGYDQRFPLVEASVDEVLLTARPLFANEIGELRGPDSSCFLAGLGLKYYPSGTKPGHFNGLLTLPFEFVLTQSFVCLEKKAAQDLLKKKSDHLEQTNDFAGSQIDDIVDREKGGALNDLTSNLMFMGEHHFVLLVKALNVQDLTKNISLARRTLSESGVVVARETLALEGGYWSQLPGNFQFRPRPTLVTSRNFAGFSSFHNYPIGKRDGNHWGSAVALLETLSGSPYYFNFHNREVGSTFICGPTGSGKTVLQGFMAAQLEKYEARGIYFDYNRGAELFIRAQGGAYFPLKNAVPTGWNPFQLEGTPENILFVQMLVRRLATGTEAELSTKHRAELDSAVQSVFELSKGMRRLSTVLLHLNRNEQEGVAKRLAKWVGDGAFAWLFDNETDELRFDNRLNGFDMTDFLDNPETRSVTMLYLFHRMSKLIDGRPLYAMIDEFWKALDDEFFEKKVKELLKTVRKSNWFLVTATQSPHDALGSGISHTIIEQTATQIFLPNPKANKEDYVDGWKLSEKEYETVRDLPEHSHCFLIKQGHKAVLAKLDLNGFDDELAILSGTTENIALLDAIRKRVGDDPSVWLPVFFDERRRK